MEEIRVIISGGGTGGHIFPAISIANAIKDISPKSQFLFVGAIGRMEMDKVPAAGYKIIGIPARGLKRPLYSLSNLGVMWDFLKCRNMAKEIIKDFKPNLVIGVGGYASAAIVDVAHGMGIPTLLQEQNSFAGLVNRKNGSKADLICVAYQNMEKFFPKDKILLTGNPIRKDILPSNEQMKEEGYRYYNLEPNKKTIFVVGGSLGCKTLNDWVKKHIESKENDYQIIWQCGRNYKDGIESFMKDKENSNIYFSDFINRMDLAYAVADIVISRAGAGTISELCVAGKCTIFVPSPIVAEDHQTHNAMALVNKHAAQMVKDSNAVNELSAKINKLLEEPQKIKLYEENIKTLAKTDAANTIAKECLKLAK